MENELKAASFGKYFCLISCLGGGALADAPGIGVWGAVEALDPITDAQTVDVGIGTQQGLIFKIECDGEKLGAVIVPYLPSAKIEFITMDETSEVIWRIDQKPAITENWTVVPGKLDSAYALVSLAPNKLIDSLMSGSDKLIIRTRGITDTLTLQNAASNIQKALDACGYNP